MTSFQLPHNRPLYEQLVERIESQIISGELGVGDQLPTEKELVSSYQVSRTVVREAMKALKEKGWVDTLVGKGTFVIDNVSRGIDVSFDLALRKAAGGSFGYLIEVREMIEPEIASLAAMRASDEQIAKVRDCVKMMQESLDKADYETFLKGDLAFHVQIAEATGNPLILMILYPVVKLMRVQQEYHVHHVTMGGQRSQVYHKLIIAALEKHDPVEARKCMQEHIWQVRADVTKVDEPVSQN